MNFGRIQTFQTIERIKTAEVRGFKILKVEEIPKLSNCVSNDLKESALLCLSEY